LSRSDKKILHIDKNDYYGGAEAAFSLQEAEEWAQRVNEGMLRTLWFLDLG
jgi:RAB protein geranylgeranyltransferase component A